MAKKKKQHTNPKSHSQKWTDGDDLVWTYDLEKKCLHQVAPKDLFQKKHFYTLDVLGENKLLVDDILTEIESPALPAIIDLIDGKLSEKGRGAIALFAAAQTLRTPSSKELKELIIMDLMESTFRKSVNDEKLLEAVEIEMEAKGHSKEGTKKFIEEAKDPDAFFKKYKIKINNIKEIWLAEVIKLLSPLAEGYFKGDWYLLRASAGKSFINSDNGITTSSCIQIDGDKQKVTQTEVVLPLSPKVCLLIRKVGSGGTFERKEDDDSVKEINMRILTHARRYVISQSKALLENLSSRFHEEWERICDVNREHIKKMSEVGNYSTPIIQTVERGRSAKHRLFLRDLRSAKKLD